MIRITDDHAPRLARLSPLRMIPAIGKVLEEGAQIIAEDARASILEGAISGPGHVPSRPGEPPNADTHDLDRSIHVGELIETSDSIRTAAIADSDHAWLERGGSRVEPRPYMEPAAERARPGVRDALVAGFRKQVAA